MSLAGRFRHPIDASCKSLLAIRYRELFPDVVDLELAEARRLMAHRFTLLGHTMDHGERIAWSRDPVSGREWSRGFSPDIVYRGPERLGEIKLPWELNKHQYFFTLGKAAWLMDDTALAGEIVRQIDHWIDDNPLHIGINWISALEAGTRAVSWIMAYPFYVNCCDAGFRRRLTMSLAQHMQFVEEHLSNGPFANTHLVGEAAALVAGGLFLEGPHTARWLGTGLTILEQEIERQVTADGVHAERSVAYHRFFLDHYYLVAALLAANGRSLSPATRARVEQMTSVLMHLLFPDGTAPAFGDGDDARGLWVRGDSPADYRGLLALGAVLFGRGDFKTVAGAVTEDVLWLMGLKGVTAFEALAPRSPDDASIAYAEAGYYVMRSGWSGSDAVLTFDCGPLGFGPAGHGHADALSFQLHAAGYPFLVDAGTFSYNLDYEWRDVFRGTRAHNTIVVDGQDQSVPRDRMSWKNVAQSQLGDWITSPWFDAIDGAHDGYRRLPDPVGHRRVAVFLKPDLWIIWDSLTARQRHRLELLLHMRPDCRIETEEGRSGVLLTSPHGRHLNIWMSTDTDDRVAFDVIRGGEQERAAWFSPAYGTRVPSQALTLTREFTGECTLMTCLSTSGHRRVVTRHGATGFHIHRDGDPEDTLCYLTEGTRSSDIKGLRFDGRLFFQRRSSDAPPVIWASRFHELSLEGLLEVRSPAMIDTLTLNENRCAIAADIDDPSQLHITAGDGIRVVMNGRSF